MSATTDVDVDLSNPTLLCISDLEGCVANFGVKPQSQKLCETETFTAIGELLKTNYKLQVAFLGDYFDQGDKMESSIAGIVGLKENATYGNRVHIILGNRDVNKMRICVEDSIPNLQKPTQVWQLWNTIFGPQCSYNPDLTGVTKCKSLLGTYGAPKLLEYAGRKGDEENGFNRMRAIFQTVEGFTEDDFVINCRKLFYHGELIKVIDVGSKKVLVSHAGTNNENIFKLVDSAQLNPPLKIKLENTSIDYFNNIENTRQLLQTNFGSSTKIQLYKSINYYNTLYKKLVEEVFDYSKTFTDNGPKIEIEIKSNLPDILKNTQNNLLIYNYFLLQAMGLKPDDDKIGDFLSPIESCGLKSGPPNACKGLNPFPDDFGKLLNTSKINAIAHGHIPFCGTVPLIHAEIVNGYKIGVLSCDTSNGNRPAAYVRLDTIPLGYIQESGIGIASIHSGKLSRAETKGFKNDGTKEQYYEPMIGHFNYEQLPTVNADRNAITYGEYKIVFGQRTFFPPLEIMTTATAGGKSRRKRRRGSKRKSGKKYSRKIRKVRYLKHKCSHGCRH